MQAKECSLCLVSRWVAEIIMGNRGFAKAVELPKSLWDAKATLCSFHTITVANHDFG